MTGNGKEVPSTSNAPKNEGFKGNCNYCHKFGHKKIDWRKLKAIEENKGDDKHKESNLSRPDSRSDPIGGSEPVSGCETIHWDSLPVFIFIFFLKAVLVLVGMQTIYVITKFIYIHKITTTGVVSIKI